MVLFAILAGAAALAASILPRLLSPAASVPATNSDPLTASADAIRSQIVEPLGLPPQALGLLLAQSALETARWTSTAFLATKSLFNRHKGNGILGVPNSDGFWTGRVHYVSPADPDLRVYSSVAQSAADMTQWLTEFPGVLAALRSGSASEYAGALDKIGFSKQMGYGGDVASLYQTRYAGIS